MSIRVLDHPLRTERGENGVVLVRLPTDELGLLEKEQTHDLIDLINNVIGDSDVRAVVITGSHPARFVSHADLAWLRNDGGAIPPLGRPLSSLVLRAAGVLARSRALRVLVSRTPLSAAIQMVRLHRTLTRMGSSSTIFVAALNGSVLGLGAEISWACDLRLMAAGDHFIGHPEILLGFPPGAGGTQRLPRIIGQHRGLVALLEGRPLWAEEALSLGAIDEIVPADRLVERALERAANLAARPAGAIGAVKRAVNVGGSLSMNKGLHVEATEFLAALPGREAQNIMTRYLRNTEEQGELALYQPGGYETALHRGSAALDIPKGE